MTYSKAGARAMMIAHQMQMQAASEQHPQHVTHVQNTIDYTNAVAEAYNEQWEKWATTELPKLIAKEVDKYLNNHKGQVQVDEQTLKVAKEKVTNMLKSIFK